MAHRPARPRKKFSGSCLGTKTYRVFVCAEDHVHIEFSKTDAGPAAIAFGPDEAFDFAQAILRGYDVATGIADRPPE